MDYDAGIWAVAWSELDLHRLGRAAWHVHQPGKVDPMACQAKAPSRRILGRVAVDPPSGVGGVGFFPGWESLPGIRDHQGHVQLARRVASQPEPQLPLLPGYGRRCGDINPGSYSQSAKDAGFS